MIRYSIIWHDDARVQAISLLTDSPDVNTIIDPIQELGEHLARTPTEATHLHEGLWKFDLRPFIAYYYIREDERRVDIELIVAK